MRLLLLGVIVTSVLGVSITPALSGEPVETLGASFAWTSKTDGEGETVVGEFYYDSEPRVTICTRQPVRQWTVQESLRTLLYYPETNSAIRMRTEMLRIFSPLQLLLSSLEEDAGLYDAGFDLLGTESRGDTLIGFWEQEIPGTEMIVKAHLYLVADRLHRIRTLTADDVVISETSFSDWTDTDGSLVPLRIEETRGTRGQPHVELLVCSNVRINAPLPDSVRTFEIPADAEVTGGE